MVISLTPSIRVRSTPVTRFSSALRSKSGWFLGGSAIFLPPPWRLARRSCCRRRWVDFGIRQLLHHGCQIHIAGCDLLPNVIPIGQLPLQDRELLRPPGSFQTLGDSLLARLDPPISEFGQPPPIPLPRHNRPQDAHARHPT